MTEITEAMIERGARAAHDVCHDDDECTDTCDCCSEDSVWVAIARACILAALEGDE